MSIKRFLKWYYIVPLAIVGGPDHHGALRSGRRRIVMLLWNWLLPPLFDWPQITLLQGFAMLVLCRILFGGFGGGGGGGGHHKRRKCASPEDRSDSVNACANAFTEEPMAPRIGARLRGRRDTPAPTK
jgi:hypothetical protein